LDEKAKKLLHLRQLIYLIIWKLFFLESSVTGIMLIYALKIFLIPQIRNYNVQRSKESTVAIRSWWQAIMVVTEYIKLFFFSFVFALNVVNPFCAHPLKGCINKYMSYKEFYLDK
jgi:hypothetical protein